MAKGKGKNKGRQYEAAKDYAEGVVEKNVKHQAQNNPSESDAKFT
ncbi:hypothetical protein AB6A23_17825 [Paenibacillus tarimensis]